MHRTKLFLLETCKSSSSSVTLPPGFLTTQAAGRSLPEVPSCTAYTAASTTSQCVNRNASNSDGDTYRENRNLAEIWSLLLVLSTVFPITRIGNFPCDSHNSYVSRKLATQALFFTVMVEVIMRLVGVYVRRWSPVLAVELAAHDRTQPNVHRTITFRVSSFTYISVKCCNYREQLSYTFVSKHHIHI